MIDVSDGLGRDAARLARASRARVVIEAARIPLHVGAGPPRRAAADGEDYELLFAVDPAAPLPGRCPDTGAAYTIIGRVESGAGCVLRDAAGVEIDAASLGWDHGP
jgi:thiamine-monophosphate kinase